MKKFHSSLLREKFVIHDPVAEIEGAVPVIALSNRLVVELRDAQEKCVETFVVRAQNMHSCVRAGALLIQAFERGGPVMNRHIPFDWDNIWNAVVNDFEYAYNPDRWIAFYHEGKAVYRRGDHHPFLDVIEKCALANEGEYDQTVSMAEEAFRQTGKTVRITYDANVALVMNFEDNAGRCAIILRGANRTTTFNFSAQARPKTVLGIPQCMSAAAAFLEGVQLAFQVGMYTEKIRLGLVERFSREEKIAHDGRKRLGRLSTEILNMEGAFDVRYRPERPEFKRIITDAERLAQKTAPVRARKVRTSESAESSEEPMIE